MNDLYREMSRLRRAARGALIAVVLAAVWATPTAAAQPTKTTRSLHPFTIPADMACPFDVQGQPDFGFGMNWTFSDTVSKGSVHAHGAYVNADTGVRYPTVENYSYVQTYEPSTGSYHVTFQGQAGDTFLPGDTGPFGTVGPHGAFYDFTGTVTFTIDASGATTQLSWKGTATDICAALS